MNLTLLQVFITSFRSHNEENTSFRSQSTSPPPPTTMSVKEVLMTNYTHHTTALRIT